MRYTGYQTDPFSDACNKRTVGAWPPQDPKVVIEMSEELVAGPVSAKTFVPAALNGV